MVTRLLLGVVAGLSSGLRLDQEHQQPLRRHALQSGAHAGQDPVGEVCSHVAWTHH